LKHRVALAVLVAALTGILLVGSRAETQGFATRRAVTKVEIAQALARPGLKIRLTLQGGEVLEYMLDRASDADTHLRLLQSYVEGDAVLWAEVDGRRNVVGIVLEGPGGRFGAAR
jgi:hypothetical protein